MKKLLIALVLLLEVSCLRANPATCVAKSLTCGANAQVLALPGGTQGFWISITDTTATNRYDFTIDTNPNTYAPHYNCYLGFAQYPLEGNIPTSQIPSSGAYFHWYSLTGSCNVEVNYYK